MKRRRAAGLLMLAAGLAGAPLAAQVMQKAVIGMGGGVCAIRGMTLTATAGQAIIGERPHAHGLVGQGFWYDVESVGSASSISADDDAVAGAAGLRCVPNPFTVSTAMVVRMPAGGRMTLNIHDALGRHIRTLADGNYQQGEHTFRFGGESLSAGWYTATLTIGNRQSTRSLLLVK